MLESLQWGFSNCAVRWATHGNGGHSGSKPILRRKHLVVFIARQFFSWLFRDHVFKQALLSVGNPM